MNKIINFFLENKLVTYLILICFVLWGISTSPFNWKTGILPSSPVAVDAIPDIGENQQIVYAEWPGRSPQDIDDQISYPLTTVFLGIPGVKTIRSNSILGLSSIYIIFNDNIDFYWSRTRILEKLNSLPPNLLPEGVSPALGPDATALGQVFWYTLEGRDTAGNPIGGWDPQELRSVQDYYVKYALSSVSGVSEVASVGGFIKEYQIDIDPQKLLAYNISLDQVIKAVKNCNLDIGAGTIESNRVEYLIRALGYVKNIEDIENSVIAVRQNVPVKIKEVAVVNYGPARRRGGIDKDGVEAVGGVVVSRYGANPLEVIEKVKDKINEISTGLPSKVLPDGRISKVTIVPFYDRTGLIKETLGTLEDALTLEILISIIVVILLIFNLRASVIISSLLPLGVLIAFIVMKYAGVDANIVSLSGIAIAIGVMVDIGIVFTENIIRHIDEAKLKGENYDLKTLILNAVVEVAPAVVTAIATTVISFLPVFAMQGAEGKLFRPLAFTKTFVMLAALFIGVVIIPTLAHLVFSIRFNTKKIKYYSNILIAIGGIFIAILGNLFFGIIVILIAANNLFGIRLYKKENYTNFVNIALVLIFVTFLLSKNWLPLGASHSEVMNFIFVSSVIALVLVLLAAVVKYYPKILQWAMENKKTFLALPIIVVLFGIFVWQGADKFFGFLPDKIRNAKVFKTIDNRFGGLGKEFMPSLDEGSFLLMPTMMVHSGVQENVEDIRILDQNINSIPEVQEAIGKWGRVNSALDPAPVSMYEIVINYKPEYILDVNGRKIRYKVDNHGAFELKDGSLYNPTDSFKIVDTALLVRAKNGEFFRQWRNEIKSPDDIWKKIIKNSKIPGLTSAPKLQPISTRIVMLQTGMRAPMGIKVYGPDLQTIEDVSIKLENELKNVEGVDPNSVFADRIVGKPYLEIEIDRNAIARYGLTVADFQSQLNAAVGGMPLTYSVEGRERYPIRIRYARELRDNPDDLNNILISTPTGVSVPLKEIATIEYRKGPQMIKSENTFLVGYVIFDKLPNYAEVDVVENAQNYLNDEINEGKLNIPAGVNNKFSGNYENQIRATKRLMLVIPIALLMIFLILYFQFRSVIGTTIIFSGIFVAFSGGFLMLWLYGQSWFMDFNVLGLSFRQLFQISTINLSVAVWVGFIALFGIASDDGVLISTYIKQLFDEHKPSTIEEIRGYILEAGQKRVRPAMMTTATTLIALLPVLTSTGKGSDIMRPMAIPIFGGMTIAILTIFVVPVLYSLWQEIKLKREIKKK